MKKNLSTVALTALTAVLLLPGHISFAQLGQGYATDPGAQELTKKIQDGRMSLKEMLDEVAHLKGVKGLVLMKNGKDLLLTGVKYSKKCSMSDYDAIIMIRAENERLFAGLKDAFLAVKPIEGGGEYFAL